MVGGGPVQGPLTASGAAAGLPGPQSGIMAGGGSSAPKAWPPFSSMSVPVPKATTMGTPGLLPDGNACIPAAGMAGYQNATPGWTANLQYGGASSSSSVAAAPGGGGGGFNQGSTGGSGLVVIRYKFQ